MAQLLADEAHAWATKSRVPSANVQESYPAIRARLELDSMSLYELRRLWAQVRADRECPAEVDLNLGAAILARGEPVLAYDVFKRSLNAAEASVTGEARKTRVRLLQQAALALAQSGATWRARLLLFQLLESDAHDGETLGLLGRVHKDLALKSRTRAAYRRYLREARRFYAKGFRLSRALAAGNVLSDAAAKTYYCGINAATISALVGDLPGARRIAKVVRDLCERRAQLKSTESWTLATLGEAELILRHTDRARCWYQRAIEAARGKWRELNSMRRQLYLLGPAVGQRMQDWTEMFPTARIAVIAPRWTSPPRVGGRPARALQTTIAKHRAPKSQLRTLLPPQERRFISFCRTLVKCVAPRSVKQPRANSMLCLEVPLQLPKPQNGVV